MQLFSADATMFLKEIEKLKGWLIYVFCTSCELEIVFVLICRTGRTGRTISSLQLVQTGIGCQIFAQLKKLWIRLVFF